MYYTGLPRYLSSTLSYKLQGGFAQGCYAVEVQIRGDAGLSRTNVFNAATKTSSSRSSLMFWACFWYS